jgi:uracil-DNA glycosylase
MADQSARYNLLVQSLSGHTCSLRAGCIAPVPGVGDPAADVMFIGEAPGRTEDERGEPFVGAAGQVLAESLRQIGLERRDVYITNIVKCRPPDNRDPSPEEVEEHRAILEEELEIVNPKLIVLLGRHALHWFLPGETISTVRGTAKRQGNRVYYITYHPAAVLYKPAWREVFFADIKKVPLILSQLQSPAGDKAVSQVPMF